MWGTKKKRNSTPIPWYNTAPCWTSCRHTSSTINRDFGRSCKTLKQYSEVFIILHPFSFYTDYPRNQNNTVPKLNNQKTVYGQYLCKHVELTCIIYSIERTKRRFEPKTSWLSNVMIRLILVVSIINNLSHDRPQSQTVLRILLHGTSYFQWSDWFNEYFEILILEMSFARQYDDNPVLRLGVNTSVFVLQC